MGSLSRPSKQNRCASCGAYWKELSLYPPELSDETTLLCPDCVRRVEEGETITEMFLPEFEPPGEPEERFSELFEAARVLLRERMDNEDRIVPTLVAANEISRGVKRWVDLKEKVLSEGPGNLRETKIVNGVPLTGGPRNLRAVKMVDGILVLERVPVSAEAVKDSWPVPPGSRKVPRTVLIQLYPHTRAATAEEVASAYEKILVEERVSCGKGYGGSIEYEFTGERLNLTVREIPLSRGWIDNPNKSGFPPPTIVGKLCRPLLEEFGERIVTRKRGGSISAVHLIPACVAFFLRASGGIEGGKEVHRLLNDHVFMREVYPEKGDTTPAVVQLWQNVKKVSRQIERTVETV